MVQPSTHLQLVDADRPRQRLVELLVTGYEDERTGEHQHGLLELYPAVVEYVTVRSIGSGGGGGKHAPLPMNLEALEFLGGSYWADPERPMPIAKGHRAMMELADPLNYRPGLEPTVLGLEGSARRALGFGPAPRAPRADALAPKPAVTSALRWLADAAGALLEHAPLLAEGVHSEALRLLVRARGLTLGSRFDATRNPCMHCHQPESVWADEDRAVCITPFCRRADGSRHCWVLDKAAGGWVEAPEPDVRGRGQVDDDQVTRLTGT